MEAYGKRRGADRVTGRDTGRDPDRERDLERIRALRPIDDEFMRVIYRDDVELAEETLRALTGVGDLRVVALETQRDLKRLGGARSLVLDVWAVDSSGGWHDIEVQRGGGAAPRRARYHSAAMDVEALGAGMRFSELPEQWVVFVMESDPFGEGRATYLFRRADESGRLLGDGANVLYANAAYEGGGALGDLLHDFLCADPDEMRGERMARRVRYFKREPEGVAEMSAMLQEMREEAMRQGVRQGVRQGRESELLANISSLMGTLGLTAEQAMDALEVRAEDRSRCLSMLP